MTPRERFTESKRREPTIDLTWTDHSLVMARVRQNGESSSINSVIRNLRSRGHEPVVVAMREALGVGEKAGEPVVEARNNDDEHSQQEAFPICAQPTPSGPHEILVQQVPTAGQKHEHDNPPQQEGGPAPEVPPPRLRLVGPVGELAPLLRPPTRDFLGGFEEGVILESHRIEDGYRIREVHALELLWALGLRV